MRMYVFGAILGFVAGICVGAVVVAIGERTGPRGRLAASTEIGSRGGDGMAWKVGHRDVSVSRSSKELEEELEDSLASFRRSGSTEELLARLESDPRRAFVWLVDRVANDSDEELAGFCGQFAGSGNSAWGWNILDVQLEGLTECLRKAQRGFIDGLVGSGQIEKSLDFLDMCEQGVGRDDCSTSVLLAMAETDCRRAIMLMRQWIENGELLTIDRIELLKAIMRRANDRLGFEGMVSMLSDDDFTEIAIEGPSGISRMIAREDIDVAKRWSLGIEDWTKSRKALTGVIEVQILEGRDDAAIQTLRDGESYRGGGGYVRSAVFSLAKRSPQRAAELVEALPVELKTHAMPILVDVWYAQDGIGASNWVAGLEIGPNRDEAVVALAMTIGKSDRVLAEQWAREVSDAGVREKVIAILRGEEDR